MGEIVKEGSKAVVQEQLISFQATKQWAVCLLFLQLYYRSVAKETLSIMLENDKRYS